MSSESALSGLSAASQTLDVIGNNVANASTVGFKQSRVLFADVFASSLGGAGSNPIGIGAKVSAVQQDFMQGNITTTSNPLDLAINGNGFFRVSDNGAIAYTRNGQFHVDNEGYVVTSDNLKLTGYSVDASGDIVPTAPVPLTIPTTQLPPTPTATFRASLNLDSRESVPTNAVFSQTDPTSYNDSTSGSVYDSLGFSHVLSLYFIKTATPGQWSLQASVDGGALSNVDLGAGAGLPLPLDFDTSGALTTTMPITPVNITVGGGAVATLPIALDFKGTSQFGANFGVNSIFQDGFGSGRLSGYNVGGDGVIIGNYTNGQSRNLGQVVFATFANPEGLKPSGNSRWAESASSGLPVVGAPGSGDLGAVQSGATEASNVDLTAELVKMIEAQRFYQANAQSIKTQDAVLQTLVNLR